MCYAEAFAKRTGNTGLWGKDSGRRFFGDKHWHDPIVWNRKAEAAGRPAFVFCASMADVFDDRAELDPWRERLWGLVEQTPWLTWMLLTKRPRFIDAMVPPAWLKVERLYEYGSSNPTGYVRHWPANVWIGATVEDQRRADERIPHLLALPAPVRFLSCEPLLGPVRLTDEALDATRGLYTINWVICGGESGGGHRELNLDHVAALHQQCSDHEVAFWMKQDSGPLPGRRGRIADELWVQERPEAIRP